jgi:hypothetical protein
MAQNRIRYLTIIAGTVDRPMLSMPLSSLPEFPPDPTWNVAHVSRDDSSGEIMPSLQHRPLAYRLG